MDPRLDGAKRDPGHLGDLSVVVPLDVVEHDRSALVVGDVGHRGREHATAFSVDGDPLGIDVLTGLWLP